MLGSCVLTLFAQKQGGAVASFEHLPVSYRLQNAAVAYIEYLGTLFWPAQLSPIYPHPAQWEAWRVGGAIIALVGLSILVWINRKRFPFGVTGWCWFLGTLVPVIGLIQVGSQAFADRYTYIPHIGLAWALVWLGAETAAILRLPKFVAGTLAVATVAALAWRTTQQLPVWKNTETLFRHTLSLFPNNAQAWYGLGSYLTEQGRTAEGKRCLEQAIQLEPTFTEAIGTLAAMLDVEGHYQEAIDRYESALKIHPDQASVLNNLAWLRASCPKANFRDGAEAVQLATRACELTGYEKPLFIGTLAAAHAEAGEFQKAITTAEQAITLATSLRLEAAIIRNRELIQLYQQRKASHGGPPKP